MTLLIQVALLAAALGQAQTAQVVVRDTTPASFDLPTESTTITVRSGYSMPVLIRLPLAVGVARADLPAGLDAQVCNGANNARLCLQWRLAAGATTTLDLQALSPFISDPIRIEVVSETGTAINVLEAHPPQARLRTGLRGFTTSRKAPIAVWETAEAKKADQNRMVPLENFRSSDYHAFVQLDVEQATPELQQLLGTNGQLVSCPMAPGVCARFVVPANGSASLPAAMLDKFATSSTPSIVLREPDGTVPASAVVQVNLDPVPPDTTQAVAIRAIDGGSGPAIPLDNTGIGDWDYVNPRKAPLVVSPGWTVLVFENRTGDRTFVVAVPVNNATATRGGRVDAVAEGLKIEPCKHVPGVQCAIVTVSPGSIQTIPLNRLVEPSRPVVRFQVAFFEEDAAPANATGFFRTSLAAYETPSRVAWGLFGRINGTTEPELPKDADGQDIRISPETTYDARTTSSMSGLVRLNVKPALGDRADADVDLLFKQSILGGLDTRIPGTKRDLDPVSVPKYRLTIFGKNGVQFSFGKFTFVETPLLAEAGEGFRLNWRNWGLARIVKRESDTHIPDRHNRDQDTWILQANNIGIRGTTPVKTLNFAALVGTDDLAENDKRYFSLYAEAFLASPTVVPMGPIQGSLAVLYSERTFETRAADTPDGEGTVFFGTITWTHLGVDKSKASQSPEKAAPRSTHRTFGLILARGTADNDDTTDRNEAYFGEAGRFGIDTMFLGSFESRLGEKPPFPRHALAGKSYLGLTYTEERLTLLMPLRWAAAILRIPDEDIVSQRATLRWHTFRLADPVFGSRGPGYEWSYENFLETPRGVRVGLSASLLQPSSSLDGLFRRDPWKFTSFIQVQM